MKRPQHARQAAGFTLLEALIALLVLSVGLLGLAGLQTRGLATGQNAYFRSQAVLLARDIAERMRANGPYLLATENSASSEYTVTYDRDDADNDACVSGTCTPQQMARFDVDQWLSELASALPAGDGEIRKQGPLEYHITVSWADSRSGEEAETKRYRLRVNLGA